MFQIGDEFIGNYTEEACDWCNNNDCFIETFQVDEDGTKHFRIAKFQREPETPEQIIERYTQQIQEALDEFARTKHYDGIMSVCSYSDSTDTTFAAEAQYCIHLRDTTWRQAYQIMDEVLAGTRPLMTIEELISELPIGSAQWPEA